MNLTEEIIRNAIQMVFVLLGAGIAAVFSGSIVLYLDVRSLKKGANASFSKIRALERKVFGYETCEKEKEKNK